METLDFDKLVKSYKTPKVKQRNFLAPEHPFRMTCIGSSNSGKTQCVLSLIIKGLTFDRLYVYSKSLNQPKYKWLMDFFDKVDNKVSKKIAEGESIEKTAVFSDELLDFSLESLDIDKINVVLIDDFLPELRKRENQKLVEELFIRSRHFNCSVIFLSQGCWASLPMAMRQNTSIFLFFDLPSRRQIQSILYDLGVEMSPNELFTLFKRALCKKFNFFVMDLSHDAIPLRYRRNWDELLVELP